MTKRHWIVVAIGVVIAIVGIGIGLSPVSLPSGVSCGNAWSTGYVPFFAEECSAARADKGIVAVVVVIAGLLISAAVAAAAYLTQAKTAS